MHARLAAVRQQRQLYDGVSQILSLGRGGEHEGKAIIGKAVAVIHSSQARGSGMFGILWVAQ